MAADVRGHACAVYVASLYLQMGATLHVLQLTSSTTR